MAQVLIDIFAHNLAPIMFFSMVAFLLFGYPIAFALAANGLFFFFIGVQLTGYTSDVSLTWNLIGALPERLLGIMRNDVLLAIPFFTFMGIVLERSGMAEDLLETVGQLFGPVRGGLAYAVVLVGALLAATTGVVAASVIAMGLISLPIMLRYGYDRRLATGVIAASGTLAQIIPPSLVLIVLADQLGKSVGDMYKGAMIPAMILTGVYLSYVFVLSIIRPAAMPALPLEARTLGSGVTSLLVALALAIGVYFGATALLAAPVGDNAAIWAAMIAIVALLTMSLVDRLLNLGLLSRLAREVITVMIPPLALVFLVLGTIFLGVATPTEGGAMGAVGALALAGIKGRLDVKIVNEALIATTRLSSFVMFILIGATVFSLTFYAVNGQVWVEELLTGLPGGVYGFLVVVSILIFVLAFFLDFFEIAFVIIPLLLPAAQALEIDLIWFGVILAVNMQTSFLTPPVGFALFYLRSVAARDPYEDTVTGLTMAPVTTAQIYKGAIPFVLLQMTMIAVVIMFPGLVTHYKGPPIDVSNVTFTVPMGAGFDEGGGGLGGGLGDGFGGLGNPFGAPPPSETLVPGPGAIVPGGAQTSAPLAPGGLGLGVPPGLGGT